MASGCHPDRASLLRPPARGTRLLGGAGRRVPPGTQTTTHGGHLVAVTYDTPTHPGMRAPRPSGRGAGGGSERSGAHA